MKKILFLLFIIPLFGYSQVDTIIKNKIYKSYFSYKYHNPLYVTYKLYKGGGECSRTIEDLHFFVDTIPNHGKSSNHVYFPKNSATPADYAGSGYDIGHMCNAEDFAYNCDSESKTFRFYNALPQTPNLNRGIWKHYETEIRKYSQHDSLLILCGGTFSTHKMHNSNVYIPDNCWKVVQSLSTHQVIYCLWFTNNEKTNSVEIITIALLEKRLGYKLPLSNSTKIKK